MKTWFQTPNLLNRIATEFWNQLINNLYDHQLCYIYHGLFRLGKCRLAAILRWVCPRKVGWPGNRWTSRRVHKKYPFHKFSCSIVVTYPWHLSRLSGIIPLTDNNSTICNSCVGDSVLLSDVYYPVQIEDIDSSAMPWIYCPCLLALQHGANRAYPIDFNLCPQQHVSTQVLILFRDWLSEVCDCSISYTNELFMI